MVNMVVHKSARFVKLTGGKITLNGKAFYERYIEKQEQSALAFQLDDIKTGIYPVYIDIDLDFMGKVTIDEDRIREKHVETAQWMLTVLREQTGDSKDLEVVMSKRQAYYKGIKKVKIGKKWEEREVTRDGFHLWLPNVLLSLPDLWKFRQKLLKDERLDFDELYGDEGCELGDWVSKKDILDEALFKRRNGLMIIGQKKPRAGTAHSIFYQNSINSKNVFLPFPLTALDEKQRVSAFRRIYGFLFLEPGHIKAPPTPVPTPPAVRKVALAPTVPKKKAPRGSFNLDAFLEIMPTVNHSSYKTAVSYFATLGLDPGETQRKCNAVWNPTAENTSETGNFMRRLQQSGDLRTFKKDFVRMMVDNKVGKHVSKVFGARILYLEGYEQFIGVEDVNLKEVEEWYRDRVSRVAFGEKVYFSYYLRNGQDTRREVTKKCPFSGAGAFVFKTEKEVKGAMEQVNWSSDKVVKSMIGLNKFKHYTKVDFIPFGPDQDSPTPKGVLNEWLGYPYQLYVPKREHKCEGDLLDEFMTEVFLMPQKKFLLKLFAYYIQFPGIRTGRFNVVKGEEGSGKTTLFHLLEAVLGRIYCKKTNDVNAYISKFNNSFKYLKVIMVDDINGLTHKIIRQLMPKATSQTEEYEPKGMARQQCNEVSEIWFTGNQDSPLCTTAKSRRDLILQTTNEWLGNTRKFARLYSMFKDRDVCKAWFDKLRLMDIDGFNPKTGNPETEVRNEVNRDSMPPSLCFLTEFFCSPWMEKCFKIFSADWVQNEQENYNNFGFNDSCSVWVTHTLLSHWLKVYMRENYPNRKKLSKPQIKKEMAKLDLRITRGVHTTDRREVWGLTWEPIRVHCLSVYNMQIEPWLQDIERDAFRVVWTEKKSTRIL